MKQIQQLTGLYVLCMPIHDIDCMWVCYSSTESSPCSHLPQHAQNQKIYDTLKQSQPMVCQLHEWHCSKMSKRMPLVTTPPQKRAAVAVRICLALQCATLHWEQRFTQGRVDSLQLKCLHHVAADSSGPLGFSQESPFLCLRAVSWYLRYKIAQGLRLKMQETTKLRVELATRFLGRTYVFYTSIVSRQQKNHTTNSIPALSCLHPVYMVKELRKQVSFLSVKTLHSQIV